MLVSTVDELPGAGGSLSVTGTNQSFSSPLYPDQVAASEREQWVLTAAESQIITLYVWLAQT
jgi:hypothetical protein